MVSRSISKEPFIMKRYDLIGSMKQSVNPFLMEDNEFTYLRNIAFDEVGSISKDGGFEQVGVDLEASGRIDLVHDYIDNSGVHTLLAVANGELYKADSDYTWTSIDDTLTADTQCTAVNRGGNAYITNSVDGLRYTNGTTLTSVDADNGAASVKGKFIVALMNELYLGNLSSIHSVNNIVYTQGGGNTFYVATEEDHDTYATTNNIIEVNDAITGMIAFQGVLVFFTEGEMFLFNPANASVTTVANIGCVDHKTIREINGVLYWANRDGIYRFNGSTLPELISLPITNWVTNSLWRVIDGAFWGSMSAVDFEGKYMIYVGDLTANLPGDDETLDDVVLVFDTYRDVWYFLTDYPVSDWTRFVNNDGNLRLIMGGRDEAAVFRKGYTYTADGAAIDMAIRSKYFHFDIPTSEKTLKRLQVTYRPEGESEKYINVKVATNGTNNYEDKITSATPSKLELDGVTGTEFQMESVLMGGIRVRTISYEFGNADSGVNMTLLGYEQQYTYLKDNINVSV